MDDRVLTVLGLIAIELTFIMILLAWIAGQV
jgi:hypothetical protein